MRLGCEICWNEILSFCPAEQYLPFHGIIKCCFGYEGKRQMVSPSVRTVTWTESTTLPALPQQTFTCVMRRRPA